MEFLHQTSKYTFLVGTTPVTISNDFGETAHTRARIQVEFENYAYEDPENFGRWRHQEVSRIYEILAPAENTRQTSEELEDQIDCGPPYDDPVTITGAIDGKTFHATGYMSGYKNGWQLSILCESKDFHILEQLGTIWENNRLRHCQRRIFAATGYILEFLGEYSVAARRSRIDTCPAF